MWKRLRTSRYSRLVSWSMSVKQSSSNILATVAMSILVNICSSWQCIFIEYGLKHKLFETPTRRENRPLGAYICDMSNKHFNC